MGVSLELANAALILLDLQNDFIHPDGIFAKKGRPAFKSPEALSAFVAKTQAMVDHMHAQGRPVIVVKTAFRPDFIDCSFGPDWAERTLGQKDGFLVEGTWGAELIDGITLSPEDTVIIAKGHSAFVGNFLDRFLSNIGVEQLMIVGGPCESALSDTSRHGAALGYDTFVASDLTFPEGSRYRLQSDPIKSGQFLMMDAFPNAGKLYAKGRSAFLVIDMQNHFLYRNPARLAENSEAVQANDRAVANAVKLARTFRRNSVPVVWVQVARRHDRADTIIRRARTLEQMTEEDQLLDDTWQQELPEAIQPHPDDIRLWKRGNSAFDGTHLHRMLRNLGVEHCYVAGGGVSACVSSTIRSGSALGYKISIVGDATYPANSEYYLNNVLATFGPVVKTDEVIASYTTPAIAAELS